MRRLQDRLRAGAAVPEVRQGRGVAAMTEYAISGTGTTWQPALRWRRITTGQIDVPELQQEWRCLETHEREWRPVPVVDVGTV